MRLLQAKLLLVSDQTNIEMLLIQKSVHVHTPDIKVYFFLVLIAAANQNEMLSVRVHYPSVKSKALPKILNKLF